jgi:glycosyltransferase involved in cell wall biosynthesis
MMSESISLIEKVLYIDLPFGTEEGAERDRSRFFWSALSGAFKADLLIINPYREYDLRGYIGYERLFFLHAIRAAHLGIRDLLAFDAKALSQYHAILSERQYDLIFIRVPALSELAWEAQKMYPYLQIIMDMDIPASIHKRFCLETLSEAECQAESKSLQQFQASEEKILSSPFTFIFANQPSLDYCLKEYPETGLAGKSWIYSQPMKKVPEVEIPVSDLINEKFILFTGDFDQYPELDALHFLLNEIYPRIAEVLKYQNIKLYLAGNKLLDVLEKYYNRDAYPEIKVVRETRVLNILIPQCQFMILPYQKGPIARTSIMLAASRKKTIVTTPLGAEGLNYTNEEILVGNHVRKIVDSILELLNDPERTRKMGIKFYQKTLEQYSVSVLTEKFITQVKGCKPYSLKIAVHIGEILPAESGAWCEPAQIPKTLSEYFDTTVFSTSNIYQQEKATASPHLKWEKSEPVRLCGIPFLTFLPVLSKKLKQGNYLILHDFSGITPAARKARKIAQCLNIPSLLTVMAGLETSLSGFPRGKMELPSRIKKKFAAFNFIDLLSPVNVNLLKNSRLQAGSMDWESYWAAVFASESNPEKCPETTEGLIFLLAGAFYPWMGFSIAVEAFCRAGEKLPGTKLVILDTTFGKNPERDKMKTFIQQQNMQDRVELVTVKTREEWEIWHTKADIRLLPFTGSTGSLAVLESWSLGLPVIQSDSVIPCRVKDKINGWVFQAGSVESLAAKIGEAYQQRNLLSQMAKAGREEVLKLANTDNLIRGLYKQYKSLISQKRK